MRVLLDTHVLLWWLADHPSLADAHRQIIRNPDNEVLVSAVTIAEISIKASLGKLDAPGDLLDTLNAGGFSSLAFTGTHGALLRDLPWHHRDPFDRMLIAQASVEGIPLLSSDRQLAAYDVAAR
ncbi:type II toxin-antitoxin system VapC family toxin [Glaciibacter flavus]|uniref:type II toxin-antitoxin system VapC family toxin n=1 Tax=Orlajensenia flava TaxID=2565934 RepID=UPI003B009B26